MVESIRQTSLGVALDITVTPGAKKTGLVEPGWNGRLRVKIRESPTKDQANRALIDYFSTMIGVCQITSGQHSKKKTVTFRKITKNELEKKLQEITSK